MKNIDFLKNELKKFKITRLICIIIVIITIPLIAITAPTSTTLATIFTLLATPSIIVGFIMDKKIKNIKQQIYDVKTIKQGIEDSKN